MHHAVLVHDLATVIVRNTGTSSLNVSSITVPAGWQLENSPTSFAPSPNGSQTIYVRFIATAGPIKTGTLVFNSNDADEPAADSATPASGGIPGRPRLLEMHRLNVLTGEIKRLMDYDVEMERVGTTIVDRTPAAILTRSPKSFIML